jgi:outer membrane protein
MEETNFNIPETPQDINKPIDLKEEIAQVKTGFFTFNINTLLLLVLFAAVIVLYLLHFTGGKADGSPVTLAQKAVSGQGSSIVFVNIDTLNEKYEFVKVLKNDLESTGKRLQNEILNDQSGLEKEAAAFQKQIASNAITEEKAKAVYEELMQKQQALMEKKDRYTQMVAEQEYKMNIRLLDTVTNFLKRYNREAGYDYIMGYKTAGEILVANDTLEITKQVLEAINKEYKDSKK